MSSRKEYRNTEKYRETRRKWYEKNKERIKKAQNEYRNTLKGKQIVENSNRRARTSVNRICGAILRNMRKNSIKRNHHFDESWWTVEKLVHIWETTKCAKTGLSFEVKADACKHEKNPFVMSPDRIDNKRGYEPDNVQFVVLIYNLMKHTFRNEDVNLFIKKLKEANND